MSWCIKAILQRWCTVSLVRLKPCLLQKVSVAENEPAACVLASDMVMSNDAHARRMSFHCISFVHLGLCFVLDVMTRGTGVTAEQLLHALITVVRHLLPRMGRIRLMGSICACRILCQQRTV